MNIMVKMLLFFSFLTASVYDMYTRKIPDAVHIVIIAAGIVNVMTGGISFLSASLSLVFTVAECILFTHLFKPFGGGDCKMMMSASFVLGIEKCLFGQVIAFALVELYCLVLYALKKYEPNKVIPLAPFLSAGFMPMLM